MRRILVFADYYDNLAFDISRRELTKGNEVYLLACGRSTEICKCNYGASSLICKICVHLTRTKLKDFKKDPSFHSIFIDELMTDEIKALAERITFSYDSVSELKSLRYKGVDVGYAAFSTYVSVTRNVMPSFNDYLKTYLDTLLRSEVCMIEAELGYTESIHPDQIVLMCGRHSNQKPLYQIAQQKGIPFVVTEKKWTEKGEDTYNLFYNEIPHSFSAIRRKMEACWDGGLEDKVEIARRFFHNRRYGIYAGDTIYIKKQIQGRLPKNFDSSKINISIFNSSEHELFSISKEYDDSGIWPNQYQALKDIFDHYSGREDIHFYLRIHPNLGGVKYRSHTMLYDLKYDNVTIIPPSSSISSYALMDHSDKVLVFNSTMGVEGTYWGKPVIALNMSAYSKMGITYQPKTKEDAFSLIDDTSLAPLNAEGCLKYAYYVMSGSQEKLKYYPEKMRTLTIGPINIYTYSQFTLFHSSFLLALVLKLLRVLTYLGVIGKYNHIAQRTA